MHWFLTNNPNVRAPIGINLGIDIVGGGLGMHNHPSSGSGGGGGGAIGAPLPFGIWFQS